MNASTLPTSWHGIRGQDAVVEQFRRAVVRGRLASSFLFAGPPGVGKRAFALKMAQALLCQTHPETDFEPCGYCPSCRQVEAGTHPDLIFVCKPAERANILLESIIGDDDHRMQEGLLHDISIKPFMGGRKIAIIDDADYLKAEGANALLKTLEEPPPRSILILIGTSPAKQLPTIRSRCQLVRFQPLEEPVVADLLLKNGLAQDAAGARRLAHYSGGSLERAGQLTDPEIWTFRGTLYQRLAEGTFDNVAFAPTVAQFIDAAGKEAPLRRRRFHQIVQFAADFYRHLLRAQAGAAEAADADLRQFLDTALHRRPIDPETTARRLERCLDADQQIDRNANQST
ncbi:MAG: DNA polymerase III subunit delta', partial [Pirellulales bacterium]|nr:DNA polymerase III subunit delta' [Pirellulales bacterium]